MSRAMEIINRAKQNQGLDRTQFEEKYNALLDKLHKAEAYFSSKYLSDKEEMKSRAIAMLGDIFKEMNDLYSKLRPMCSTKELISGFAEDKKSVEIDLSLEAENIVERIHILQSDFWQLERLEYLRKSQKLIVCFIRPKFWDQATIIDE